MATALATRDVGLLRTAQAIYRKGIDDIQAAGPFNEPRLGGDLTLMATHGILPRS